MRNYDYTNNTRDSISVNLTTSICISLCTGDTAGAATDGYLLVWQAQVSSSVLPTSRLTNSLLSSTGEVKGSDNDIACYVADTFFADMKRSIVTRVKRLI